MGTRRTTSSMASRLPMSPLASSGVRSTNSSTCNPAENETSPTPRNATASRERLASSTRARLYDVRAPQGVQRLGAVEENPPHAPYVFRSQAYGVHLQVALEGEAALDVVPVGVLEAQGVLGDQDPLYVLRTLAGAEEVRPGEVPGDWILVFQGDGAAAVDLGQGLGRVPQGFGSEVLGVGALPGGRLAPVLEVGALVGQETGGLYLHRHVGDEALDQLVLAEAVPANYTLVAELYGPFQASLGDADRPGRDRQPPEIEGVHRHAEAVALVAEQVPRGHPAVLQENLERREEVHVEGRRDLARHKTRRVGLYDERRYPLVSGFGVRLGKQHARVGDAGERGPLLVAVEEVPVGTVARGPGLHGPGRVRPAAGLRQAEKAYLLPLDQRRHVPLYLLFGAPVEDGEGHRHRLGVERRAYARTHP